jgi:DnaJ like chaperone protein
MSIWDKLAASTELAIGGRIGALLDGMKGDRVVDPDRDRPENQVAFTVGVIALGAKMARADGVVTRDEIFAFKEAFKVSDAEMKHAARVFNLAKQDVAGYEACAEQLVTIFKGNRKLLEDVLEGLFHIAKADEALHPEEEQFLGQVAKRFGFTDTEFGHVKARHVIAAKRNPYDVLGVKPSISDEELMSHYRRLLADNHPNKLIARGVPEEFVTIATEKIVTFNEAYGAIAKQRGI